MLQHVEPANLFSYLRWQSSILFDYFLWRHEMRWVTQGSETASVKVLLRLKICCYLAQRCIFKPRKNKAQAKICSPTKYSNLLSREAYFHIRADWAAYFPPISSGDMPCDGWLRGMKRPAGWPLFVQTHASFLHGQMNAWVRSIFQLTTEFVEGTATERGQMLPSIAHTQA